MMHHGFIKVAVGTPEIRVGDCGFNANNVRQLIEIAAKAEARLLVLSELCLTGCTCADLFYQDTLLDYAEDALSSLITESVGHD
ncbi:MAG TPA: NAD(+) synthase, partial [Clostridia bacterium]|nr:NAD(+) synthase [Clostridia bacterium]